MNGIIILVNGMALLSIPNVVTGNKHTFVLDININFFQNLLFLIVVCEHEYRNVAPPGPIELATPLPTLYCGFEGGRN